jgi:general secretion pathway protein E
MTAPAFETVDGFLNALKTGDPTVVIPGWLRQLERESVDPLLHWDLIESFEAAWLTKTQLLPIAYLRNCLFMAHPQASQQLQAALTETLQQPVFLYPCSQHVLERFLNCLKASEQPASPKNDAPSDISVSQTFKQLLFRAKQYRASDIHLEPQSDHAVLVRYRIDGLLHDVETLHAADFDFNTRLVSKIKVAADLDIAETRIPQDGRITERIEEEPVDLRVSTLPSLHGEKVVIRLLPHKNPFQELRDLGLEGEALLTYYNWIKKPQGMVLITGQTGSGKTSTLYTTLSHILNAEKNVVTIEDPIEYQLKGATQVQVHPKVGLSFANGLRSILRQDPDTILLGEIRDAETAEIAYQAALTGHLVLSTLHTNDAPSAIIRLMDIQVEPYLIASATLGVVAQRLIRRICPHCAQAYTPGQDLLHSLHLNPKQDYEFFKAIGCDACFQTGYYGREGIFEVMPVDDTLANLITQKEQLNKLRGHLQAQKVQSLYESAIAKVVRGLSTVEEIHRVVPPSQHTQRSARTGSIFVYILFLISILSILILNMATLFEGGSSLFKLQKQALQSQYAAQAALNIGELALKDKLPLGQLYWLSNASPSGNVLLGIPAFQGFLIEKHTVPIEPGQLDAQYRIQAQPQSPEQPGISSYTYRIQAKGIVGNRDELQRSPLQEVSGQFQLENGPVPLSLFERYAALGSIPLPDTDWGYRHWYSPQAPDSKKPLPSGYLTSASIALTLPSILWPTLPTVSGDATLSFPRPSVWLTPTTASTAISYPLGSAQPNPKAFQPDTQNWAISIYGNVDRLLLNAESPQKQVLEVDQFLLGSASPDKAGYQKRALLKTIITLDQALQRAQIDTQRWEWTLSPQRKLVNQRAIQMRSESFPNRFDGLMLVYGAIQQVAGGEKAGESAYAIPLSIFTTQDIGLPQSIQAHPLVATARLGLISQEGAIQFQPLAPSPMAQWDSDPQTPIQIQAALAASQYQLVSSQPVSVLGSVAVTHGTFPAGLATKPDARLSHLASSPPYYPVLNPGSQGVLITQPPTHRHWQLRHAG